LFQFVACHASLKRCVAGHQRLGDGLGTVSQQLAPTGPCRRTCKADALGRGRVVAGIDGPQSSMIASAGLHENPGLHSTDLFAVRHFSRRRLPCFSRFVRATSACQPDRRFHGIIPINVRRSCWGPLFPVSRRWTLLPARQPSCASGPSLSGRCRRPLHGHEGPLADPTFVECRNETNEHSRSGPEDNDRVGPPMGFRRLITNCRRVGSTRRRARTGIGDHAERKPHGRPTRSLSSGPDRECFVWSHPPFHEGVDQRASFGPCSGRRQSRLNSCLIQSARGWRAGSNVHRRETGIAGPSRIGAH